MYISRLIPILLASLAIAFTAHGQKVYNPASDFSATENPHGVWTFGWSTEIAGDLHVYPDLIEKASAPNWVDKRILSAGAPCVAFNCTNDILNDVPAHTMYIHPGPQGQFSHCIFKAPAAALYDIRATFTAISTGGPHVYILHNGLSLGSSHLKQQDRPWTFSSESIDMAAGDTLDVAVGIGTNKVFFSDGTAFTLTITAH